MNGLLPALSNNTQAIDMTSDDAKFFGRIKGLSALSTRPSMPYSIQSSPTALIDAQSTAARGTKRKSTSGNRSLISLVKCFLLLAVLLLLL
jgi:hypothetical protein